MITKDEARAYQKMRWPHIFKVLARSGSLSFTLNAARGVRSDSLEKLRWRGNDVFYRPGTSDVVVLYQILLRSGKKAEYYVPRALNPKVILDIGSNIGASILYFRYLFPEAKIFGFEPHPETFKVLRLNVAESSAVSLFNYGLGAADTKLIVPFAGVNFSAFRAEVGSGNALPHATPTECEIRDAGNTLRHLGIPKVDLLKVDCEGGEFDIFTALSEEMLRQCKWIVGEMHNASAFKILELLAPHFDLDLKKMMFSPFFRFHACNLAHAAELQGTFDPPALQT
jgi:FkbM family methyltransferase